MHMLFCVCRFLFRKLVQFQRVGAPKRCVAGVQPFSGFLLKNQPNPPDTPLPDDSKPLPKPHPESTRTHTHNNENKRAKRFGRQPQATKKPKMAPEKQRGGLVLGSSDHSSGGEWSESDGELIIDTQGTGPSHSKRDVGKKKKESGVAKKGVGLDEEEAGEGGEGK